jgi:KUP system potassium uptake protein
MKPDSIVPFRRTLGLTLGALGVVFGDIGTSPLYAMRETALAASNHAPPSPSMARCR